MGVAVDHRVDAVAREPFVHRRRIHIGHRLHRSCIAQHAGAGLAGGTRLLREREPGGQGLGQHLRLPARIADLAADGLVFEIAGAQQVAMGQQHRRAI